MHMNKIMTQSRGLSAICDGMSRKMRHARLEEEKVEVVEGGLIPSPIFQIKKLLAFAAKLY